MSNEKKNNAETLAYAQRVYTQMHGFYKEGAVPGVTEEDVLEEHYEEIYNALERLGERFGFDADDKDRECLLNALEDMLLESGIKMFMHGVEYAQEKR